jgi:hypothetical protein
MAMFPILEIEEKVQINDKTRLSAIKSFVSKGETAIATMTITPGSGGPSINVYNTDTKERYTDWAWTAWSFDVDSTNAKIDFEEAGTDYVATVASSTYTSFATLVSAIQTALNGAGASGTFTCSIDEADRITVESTVSFRLLAGTGDNRLIGMLRHIGFGEVDSDNSTELTGDPVEYGLRKIVLSINNGGSPVTHTLYQKVYTEAGDRLFASDSDLQTYEEDILKWVSPGRSSFKDVHRTAQKNIMDWIDGQGYRRQDGEPFTKFDIVNMNQVSLWASYLALALVFEGNSNAVDDVFDKKSKFYQSKATQARNRFVAIDLDQDGKIDFDENLRLHSGSLFRR